MVSDEGGVVRGFRRWWWLVPAALLIGIVAGLLLTPEPPLETSFRATVLIPGDTEGPGSAERPELMVLDDLGPFAESRAFAELVAEELGDDVPVDEIDGMVNGSRYSRIGTIEVAGDDAERLLAVAVAAAAVFPEAVNTFLVAEGDAEATVRIIDPPLEPARDSRGRWVRVGALGLLGAGVATVAILLISPDTTPRRPMDVVDAGET